MSYFDFLDLYPDFNDFFKALIDSGFPEQKASIITAGIDNLIKSAELNEIEKIKFAEILKKFFKFEKVEEPEITLEKTCDACPEQF